MPTTTIKYLPEPLKAISELPDGPEGMRKDVHA